MVGEAPRGASDRPADAHRERAEGVRDLCRGGERVGRRAGQRARLAADGAEPLTGRDHRRPGHGHERGPDLPEERGRPRR
eukprot:12169267-Alexandrium_andersonii.AAC.1